MPGPKLHYTMLFTDQGMGNLITLTKDTGNKVEFAALIDFGSSRRELAADTVQFLVAYIDKRRAAAGYQFDLDLVVISHSDDDHWSMFANLLDHYDKKGPALKINRFIYGGQLTSYWKFKSYGRGNPYNVIDDLKKYAKDSRVVPKNTFSAYDKKAAAPLAVTTVSGVKFTFIAVIGNAVGSGTVAHVMNTASLCVGVVRDVDGGRLDVLLPGDMTFQTIKQLYDRSARAGQLGSTVYLSLPHHGSRATIADNYKASGTTKFAKWFAGATTPQALAVSAGFMVHRHPYSSVINLFSDTLTETSGDDHVYITYRDSTDRYAEEGTDSWVYTSYNSGLKKIKGEWTTDSPYHMQASASRYIFTVDNKNKVVSWVDPGAAPAPGMAIVSDE